MARAVTSVFVFAFAVAAIALIALAGHAGQQLAGAGVAASAPPVEDFDLPDEMLAPMFATVIVDGYSHAAAEHPEDMPVVRKCLEDPGTWKAAFRTDQRNRFLQVCFDGRNVVFQIVDRIGNQLKERTAYIKDEFHTLTDVTKYVDRMRYFRIRGGLQ